LLAEVAEGIGKRSYILNLVAEYSIRLTLQTLRLTGGDRFAPWQLVEVNLADTDRAEAHAPERYREAMAGRPRER
jgi:hypothetical protein